MLQFRIQSTPNPLARKYVLNQDLVAQGKVTYRDRSECEHVPLATSLLSLEGVTQIHLFENVLTISQDGSWDWGDLDSQVQETLIQQIEGHDIRFELYQNQSPQKKEHTSPELIEIDAILDRTIRPGLQLDGGDLELLGFENNFLTIRYMGACGGCPSSMTGTLNAIRQILADEYDPNIEVVAL
ncbi:MAG: NifU family protein [Zetaproteobacteria bacterium]|nr:NifU family protein [Zetaproteobacteria bacterium]